MTMPSARRYSVRRAAAGEAVDRMTSDAGELRQLRDLHAGVESSVQGDGERCCVASFQGSSACARPAAASQLRADLAAVHAGSV